MGLGESTCAVCSPDDGALEGGDSHCGLGDAGAVLASRAAYVLPGQDGVKDKKLNAKDPVLAAVDISVADKAQRSKRSSTWMHCYRW